MYITPNVLLYEKVTTELNLPKSYMAIKLVNYIGVDEGEKLLKKFYIILTMP